MGEQVRILLDASNVVVLVSWWSCFLLPFALATFWRWWLTEFGQSVVWVDMPVVLALLPSSFHRMFGIDDATLAFQWFVVVSVGLIPFITVWRGWVLLQTQRRGRPYREIWIWNTTRKGEAVEPKHRAGTEEK